MNNNQQFDDHIKEQFSNYSPEVHPRIWENIVAARERRKPVGLWVSLLNGRNKLLILGLLIAMSTGGAWLYYNVTSDPVNTKNAAEKNSIKDKGQSSIDKETLPGNNPTDLKDIPLDQNNDKTTTTNNDLVNTDPSLLVAGGTKVHVYSPSLEPVIEKSSVNNPQKKYSGLGSVLNVNTESPGLAEDDLTGQGSLLGRLTFAAQKLSAGNKKKTQSLLSFSPIIYLPGCPSLEKNAAGNKKYLEIYAGPDYSFRSLSDTGNSVYLQKRKESEKFRSAYSAGIRYTKVFRNSMSIRAGVNYSQINEKFTFTKGNLVQVTYIIDANGDTTGSYITTGTRYKTTINRYRSIDVPIVVGYELGNGKLHANINAGAVVNIYSWQKGEVLDKSLNPVTITTGKNSSPSQFKTNAGIGFIGAVSVYYKVSDKIHIMAEPYFRYNLTPMNKENTTLKQKYHTAGLRLGIRLDIK